MLIHSDKHYFLNSFSIFSPLCTTTKFLDIDQPSSVVMRYDVCVHKKLNESCSICFLHLDADFLISLFCLCFEYFKWASKIIKYIYSFLKASNILIQDK